jgi:hypothetical protein
MMTYWQAWREHDVTSQKHKCGLHRVQLRPGADTDSVDNWRCRYGSVQIRLGAVTDSVDDRCSYGLVQIRTSQEHDVISLWRPWRPWRRPWRHLDEHDENYDDDTSQKSTIWDLCTSWYKYTSAVKPVADTDPMLWQLVQIWVGAYTCTNQTSRLPIRGHVRCVTFLGWLLMSVWTSKHAKRPPRGILEMLGLKWQLGPKATMKMPLIRQGFPRNVIAHCIYNVVILPVEFVEMSYAHYKSMALIP